MTAVGEILGAAKKERRVEDEKERGKTKEN